MNVSRIKGFLNRNYFVKPEKVLYTWRENSVRESLLNMNFKQTENEEINLWRGGMWIMCYRIDVKRKLFNACELPVDDNGILIVDDGFFEKGDIEEWKNKLL